MNEARIVWVVQADVLTETYRTLEVCANEQAAHSEAAKIVKRLFQAAGQGSSWHDDSWQNGLQKLRYEHMRRGGDADDYAVWIEPKTIRGQAGTDAAKVSYETTLSNVR